MPCTVSAAALKALFTWMRAALQLGADDGDHVGLARQRARVVNGQQHTASGAFAARLHRRPAAPDDDDVPAELLEDVLVAAPEAFARRREDDDRDHAPEDPEHGEEAAQLVGAQVRDDLCKDLAHLYPDRLEVGR